MPSIILHNPQIPPNTGNIIRLAANCGFHLHIIEPIGFSLSKKAVKRAKMDYQELANVKIHANLQDCLRYLNYTTPIIISTKGKLQYCDHQFTKNDVLLFGNENIGLPKEIWQKYASSPCLYIPMRKNNRSINLANSVAIVCYECWRQLHFQ